MRPSHHAAAALLTAVSATLLPLSAQAADCGSQLSGPSRQVAEADGQRIVFVVRPWPVTVGRPFALDITVCAATGAATGATTGATTGAAPPRLLRLDADMPAHRHGMNYRPGLTPLGQGRYRAEGLMFHMPGHWRLHFDLDGGAGAAPRLLSTDLTIE